MKRLLSFVLLTAFLNFEVSHALVEVMNSPRNSGDGDKKASSTNSSKNSSDTKPFNANAAKGSVQPNSPPLNIPSHMPWSQSEIDSVFASFAVPPANIPVLENALGDVVQDSVVNILDLLRVRDIAIGRGPAASGYEKVEGDMNGDSTVTSDDVAVMRDVLLQKVGLPHVIGSSGGQVVGNAGRTTFNIPAGHFGELKRMCVEDYGQASFEQDFGTSLSELGRGVSYMAGAKLVLLNPSSSDSALKPGIEMIEQVPDGMQMDTTGVNAVFNVGRDTQGSGVPDFKLLGDLEQDSTGRRMIFRKMDRIIITEIERVIVDPLTRIETPIPSSNLEPGMTLVARGTGWQSIFPSDYEVLWIAAGDTFSTQTTYFSTQKPSSKKGITGVIFNIPLLPTLGSVEVVIHCISNGATSNSALLFIDSSSDLTKTGLKDSLLQVYTKLDTVFSLMIANSVTQQIASIERFDLIDWISKYRAAVDSFAATPESQLNPIEIAKLLKVINNLKFNESYNSIKASNFSKWLDSRISSGIDPPNPKPECLRDCTFWYRLYESALALLDVTGGAFCAIGCCGSLPVACAICVAACAAGAVGVNRLFHQLLHHYYLTCLEKCCPEDYVVTCEVIDWSKSGQPGYSTFEFKFVCIHFKWHAMVAAPYGKWECYSGCEEYRTKALFSCNERPRKSTSSMHNSAISALKTDEIRDFTGMIIQLNNSPIPLSKGVVGSGGVALIPFNVMEGNISLSAYDPITGLYDNNVAEVQVGDPFNEAHVISLSFNPDTSVVRHPFSIGPFVQNSVSIETPRHEYRFFVSPSAVGSKLNVGLRAEQPLTFWLQDPSGHFIHRDSSTACEFVNQVVPTVSGTYQITVTYGVSGGDGPFTLGVNYSPYPPTPYLCSDIPYDTLYSGFSPYISADPATVLAGDTLTVEARTTIQFKPGGSITANSIMHGTATPANPIILKPADGSSQQAAMSYPRAINKRPSTQAEGKR